MTPLKVTETQWQMLQELFAKLSINFTIKQYFHDGMVVIERKQSNATKYVHWFELLYDVILPALAKRKVGSHWISKYQQLMNQMLEERLHGSKVPNESSHPVDFAYRVFKEIESGSTISNGDETFSALV